MVGSKSHTEDAGTEFAVVAVDRTSGLKMILSPVVQSGRCIPREQGLWEPVEGVGVVDVVTYLPGWMENLPVARGAEVGVVLSAATVAQVDLPGDARNPRDRPRDLVQTAGDFRGPPRINLPVRDRAN